MLGYFFGTFDLSRRPIRLTTEGLTCQPALPSSGWMRPCPRAVWDERCERDPLASAYCFSRDDLSSRKAPVVRERIEAAGASFLDLPPYSPDFNPTERPSPNSRLHPRKAAERTIHGLGMRLRRNLSENRSGSREHFPDIRPCRTSVNKQRREDQRTDLIKRALP